MTLLKSLYHDIVSVFQPASDALDAEVFNSILRYGRCTGCVIPPYLLEEMLSNPEHFDTLANLDFVQFGSGPLSQTAGKLLLTRQKNCPHFMGSSECGLYLLLELDDPVADWQYFRFHPWSGVNMRPIDDKNQNFEMVIVKSGDHTHTVPGMQPVFELFPEMDEWNTHDLYVRHPTKPDHWRCIGRNDDVIVLSNGEKLNPVDTEGRISGAHPAVSGVLVFGQGQFMPGLLLEVRGVDVSDAAERSRLIEEIWPSIQRANQDAPSHGRLDKELILLASPDKPFLRTPKLSLRRKPTLDMYTEEIAQMYQRYMEGRDDNSDSADSLDLDSESAIQAGLSTLICSDNGWDEQPDPDADLFMLGIDSLQVLRLGRKIKAAMVKRGKQDDFDTRMLYRNPTLKSLSHAIYEKTKASPDTAQQNDTPSTDKDLIETLIARYSQFDTVQDAAKTIASGTSNYEDQKLNVVLTGTTGSLGSYLLLTLLAKPNIGGIYCLNRAEDAESRQLGTFTEQGVEISHISGFKERVQFLQTPSLGAPQLGLSDSGAYEKLKKSNITHIIHNQWPVNFNIRLASFESHLAGVRGLINFSATFPDPPMILFVSSLSSITTLTGRETVPEAMITDSTAPSPMGYGESKYAAEHVLNNATKASQGAISTAILRVGQIAGPVKSSTAAWPEREWLPSLVISSRTVQALPDTLGRMEKVDWMPVDLLADGICEILESHHAWDMRTSAQNQPESNVFHVVNPGTTTWADIIAPLLSETGIPKTVSLKDWIELVRQGPEMDAIEHRNPAKKILPFYEALAGGKDVADNDRERFAKGNMARCSETFRQMPLISGEMLVKWSRQWA